MYAFTIMFTLLAQGPAEAGVERVGLFTAERFLAHAAFLGSDNLKGRKAGSEGAAKAAEYIAEKFKEAGLKPAGDDGTYFQGFTIHDEVKGRNVLGIRPGAGRWPWSTLSSRPISITWAWPMGKPAATRI